MKEDWKHIERRATAIAALRNLPDDNSPGFSFEIKDTMIREFGRMPMNIQAFGNQGTGLLPKVAYEIFTPLIAEGMKKYRDKLEVIADGLADE